MKKWLQVIISLVMVLSMVMGSTTAFAKTEENVAVALDTPILDSFGEDLSASVLRADPDLCTVAAIMMLLDIMGNDEIDTTALVKSETMWVVTVDDTVRCIYLTSDGLHLADYIPNQFASYVWASLEIPDADAMQTVLEENFANGEYDSLHYCTPDEISAVFAVLDDLEND